MLRFVFLFFIITNLTALYETSKHETNHSGGETSFSGILFCIIVKGIKVSDCRTKANKFVLKREKEGKRGVEKLAN